MRPRAENPIYNQVLILKTVEKQYFPENHWRRGALLRRRDVHHKSLHALSSPRRVAVSHSAPRRASRRGHGVRNAKFRFGRLGYAARLAAACPFFQLFLRITTWSPTYAETPNQPQIVIIKPRTRSIPIPSLKTLKYTN